MNLRNSAKGAKEGEASQHGFEWDRKGSMRNVRWKEHLLVAVFLGLISITLTYFVYRAWFLFLLSYHPAPGHDLFQGTDYAPNQYRLAIPYLSRFLSKAVHLKFPAVYGVLNLVIGYAAMYLLYLRLSGEQWLAAVDIRSRMIVIAIFLAVLQFPIAWVVPWQRPETLPSAAYIALSLLLLTQLQSRWWMSLVVLAGAGWQGFVRSDLAMTLGLGILIVALLSRSEEIRPIRWRLAWCGAGVFGVAVCIQAWLQFVMFPHAIYPPDTALFQYRYNLSFHQLSIFGIALLPYAILFLLLHGQRAMLNVLDWITITASLLYLALWFTVGVASEVRIFVPYYLAFCPIAAKVVYGWLGIERTSVNV